MSQSYDIQTYLLDKENIRDTLLLMMYAFDQRDSVAIVEKVYTPEVTINYPSHLVGRGREVMSSQTWADRLEHLHDQWDTTEHIVHNVLAKLPHPNSTTQKPDTCKVYALAHGIFYKNDEEGMPRIMGRRQGGSYDLDFVRLKEKEEQGENPWRIKVQNVRLDWQDLPKA